MPTGSPVDPTRPQPREQNPVSRAAKDNLPQQGFKEQLQALLIESPFLVLTQILTFALELETRIIKPQISKHNCWVLVQLPEAGMENTPFPPMN